MIGKAQRALVLTLGLAALLPVAAGAATGVQAGQVSAQTYTEGSIGVRIDDQAFEFDPAPYVLPPGRAMVPLRGFFEALGATVTWHEPTHTVTGTLGDRTVRLVIGSKTAYVGDLPVQLEVAPELRMDRTFVPLRFVAESLNGSVRFDADQHVIEVWSHTEDGLRRPLLGVGTRLRFRSQLVRLFLNHSFTVKVEQGEYPLAVTYTVTQFNNAEAKGSIQRTATGLADSRRFFPADFAKATTETAPWLSRAVLHDLKSTGNAEHVIVGGTSRYSDKETTLTVRDTKAFAVTLNGKRVQLPVLELVSGNGDRLWVMDDVSTPLVVKFQPAGEPMPDELGIGYQLESIDTAP